MTFSKYFIKKERSRRSYRLYTKPLWFCILYFWEFDGVSERHPMSAIELSSRPSRQNYTFQYHHSKKATQLVIISGDLCRRNGLKSKVSTLEELYDFSLKILKITLKDVILELSTLCRQAHFYNSIVNFLPVFHIFCI